MHVLSFTFLFDQIDHWNYDMALMELEDDILQKEPV